jgi:FtsZ-binding cell division protein ZapB|tara:strand:- start:36 stop:254 length:219 start_codon:yes stop_codon:yes gene_type:complete
MSNSEEQGRNESFLENEVQMLTSKVKVLEYECAELQQSNSELQERVKKLASRQPAWPKGYRPQRRQTQTQSR